MDDEMIAVPLEISEIRTDPSRFKAYSPILMPTFGTPGITVMVPQEYFLEDGTLTLAGVAYISMQIADEIEKVDLIRQAHEAQRISQI